MNGFETVSAPESVSDVERDWRFADLVLHALIDPGLAGRYRRDPRAVLAGYGLHLAVDATPPALPAADARDLVVEDLDHGGTDVAFFTLCWVDEDVQHAVPAGR
ncbi:hypothetical protein AB0O28_21835 [Microbispora sp. NPDC088329]|uniref:hypothetical protein n=1 Tax=Microbispora sp. NPDC088329 TaxID=3154869 RepID=UPI003417CCC8